jgi:RHS repeat-associated protein
MGTEAEAMSRTQGTDSRTLYPTLPSYYRARYYDPSSGRFQSEDRFRWAENGNFYSYVRNRPLYFRDPSGWLSIGPGFSPQCLADLLNAIQILKQRAKSTPCCNNFFASQGLHMPLDTMIDSPLFTVNFDPNGNVGKNEKGTFAYTNPGNSFDINVTPLGCGTGPTHLAQDLAHELAHLSLGHASEYYNHHPLPEKPDHARARQAESACGFAIQSGAVTSIVVTPQ